MSIEKREINLRHSWGGEFIDKLAYNCYSIIVAKMPIIVGFIGIFAILFEN